MGGDFGGLSHGGNFDNLAAGLCGTYISCASESLRGPGLLVLQHLAMHLAVSSDLSCLLLSPWAPICQLRACVRDVGRIPIDEERAIANSSGSAAVKGI